LKNRALAAGPFRAETRDVGLRFFPRRVSCVRRHRVRHGSADFCTQCVQSVRLVAVLSERGSQITDTWFAATSKLVDFSTWIN